MKRDNSFNISKSLLRELPYYGVNLLSAHGQFNNTLGDHLPTKKYLESLTSVSLRTQTYFRRSFLSGERNDRRKYVCVRRLD